MIAHRSGTFAVALMRWVLAALVLYRGGCGGYKGW